jgi:hypothetical protein
MLAEKLNRHSFSIGTGGAMVGGAKFIHRHPEIINV